MDCAPREGLRWDEWDWRPLARCALWAALALLWAAGARVLSWGGAAQALRQAALLLLVTFGLAGQVLALLAMGALRLFLEFDEAAFALAERLVRPWAGRASFAARFAAAFSAELAFVLGSVGLWRLLAR